MPLLTVTADTLVAADFSSRRRPRTAPRKGRGELRDQPQQTRTRRRTDTPTPSGALAPYRALFQHPGTLRFTAGGILARLPMGMFSVSAILMIAGARGSYALAGAVVATGLAATGLVAPWTARLVDRHGQARIAVPATAVALLGALSLIACVHWNAPAWTLFASYAATATVPNTGGMSRARWAHLLKGDPAALHTANSFEQAADELCFMIGPVAAAFLCTTLFPEAGTLVGGLLCMTGVLLFTAQRATEPPPTGRTTAKSPLRATGIPPLLAVFLATGAVFGSLEVVTIAYADARGHASSAGVILGLQAAGSCAAGLAYGALRVPGPTERRLRRCLAAMTVLMALPWLTATATGSLLFLAPALLLAGMATAPTMVTAMALVQRRTPQGQLNEGMTLAVTGLLGGIAGGSALGGWVVEHATTAGTGPAPDTAGFAVPVAAAALALLIAVIRPNSRSPIDAL
ncbi:MFS transporter [Streptomyces caniscabiei]|nr:MFS transporter [Streptomyces caniscabiei]MDX3514043.1 MFS transporter [Streptomyces caniscabiei]MDX3723361.1 MFS transporter [Streptomyces caniscabiei]MDX3730302.1 MFS transporter [Streptomyces caniscabiei]WEO26603.1 MFS transporter [Streptomyces caniscabiei]